LYELLSGRHPFEGIGPGALARAVCEEEPTSPRSLRPGLDRALEAVVLKCLEKDQARRYASSSDLADDLVRWRRGEAPKVYPEGWPQRLRRQVLRRPLTVGFALLVVALGVTLLVMVVWAGQSGVVPELWTKQSSAKLALSTPVPDITDTYLAEFNRAA